MAKQQMFSLLVLHARICKDCRTRLYDIATCSSKKRAAAKKPPQPWWRRWLP